MKRFEMKKLGIIFVIACLLMTGCTGSENSGAYKEAVREPAAGEGFDYMADDVEPAVEEAQDTAKSDEANADASNSSGKSAQQSNTTNKVDKEKLVFRCSMVIDTLEYTESIKSFRNLIKKYDGFVENENESDDGTTNGYYYYDEMKQGKRHSTYTATVRIPSARYDDFCEETGGIGEVRTRNANVENVSQSYYNLQAELEVLEAKYQRYLEMLKKAVTTKDIIEIENTITNIEVQINQIKTQLNRYDNDVAYSYVSVTIKEVEKIVQEEEQGTVSNAFSGSMEAFGEVCHSLFIIFIYFLPYLIVILVILIIVWLATMPVRKKHKAAKKLAKEKQAATLGGQAQMTPPADVKPSEQEKK